MPRSVQERGWGTYCSQACTARRVARACQVCGSQFSVKQSVADEGRGLYCSNDCRHLGKRDQVDKTCEACGTAFSVPQSIKNRRTCSRTCWWKIMGTDPGRAAILARARHDMLTNRAPTRPERILYALLDTLTAEVDGLRWERQLRLLDRWTVDAAIPALQLVLQADGDYWHGFHPKYHTDPRVRHHMANDAFQDRKLTAAGWTVHRFWERDLIHNLPSCTQRLRAAITERTAPPAARR
nr:endonuclease domain-containing protein [Streptomyces sp. NBC_01177]